VAGKEVRSAHTHTSATLVTGRSRLQGVVINTSTGATGNVILYDNTAASGTVLLEVDEKESSTVDVIIPNDGILAKKGIYVDLPSNVTITVFYQQ
jgi:hypothetical protein